MNIIDNLQDLHVAVDEIKAEGRNVGFVPTMGALHEGHMELVRQCVHEMSATVVSIFVNPTQFNDPKDFESYPNTLPEDLKKLEENGGVDIVFMPKVDDMYPKGSQVMIEPGPMAHLLCGITRQGHFRGVLTVVMKLLNMVQPHAAFFGAKDYQQFSLISKMVSDLNMTLQLRLIPTVREEDGLAMSSRNIRLTPRDREAAPLLFQTLEMGHRSIRQGQTQAMEVIASMMTSLIENSHFEIDYLSIVNPHTLEDLENVDPKTPYLIATAAYLGPVRLIDNLLHLPTP